LATSAACGRAGGNVVTWRLGRRHSRRALLATSVAAVAARAHSGAAQDSVEHLLAGMTLRQRVARMFIFPVSGPTLAADEAAWLADLQPGGVILVERNFGAANDVRSLTSAIHASVPYLPPLVSLDQEGGIVTRLWDDPAPDAPTLGTLTLDEIRSFAQQRAELLASYGFDLNFAPVADVAFDPDSFMAGRTFGDNPEWVAECVVAYLNGVQGTQVLHCVKHFPGHGRVSVDSHQALPELDVDPDTWASADALPFAAAIADGVPMVMLGHLAVPMWDDLPASLSPIAVSVLRESLGFDGVIVTDDLYMGALSTWQPLEIIDMAIEAGVDLLLYVDVPDAPDVLVDHVVSRVAQGQISEDRILESARRIVTTQLAVAG
jgi:beta-N-acetylhexosaminidase